MKKCCYFYFHLHQLGQNWLLQQLANPCWSGAVVFIAAANVRPVGSSGRLEVMQDTFCLTGTTVLVACQKIRASVLEGSRKVPCMGSCENLSPGMESCQCSSLNTGVGTTSLTWVMGRLVHLSPRRYPACHFCRLEQSLYRCSLFSTLAFPWRFCDLLRVFLFILMTKLFSFSFNFVWWLLRQCFAALLLINAFIQSDDSSRRTNNRI